MNTKSATTAGLLGIFLGSFGAHNWYLGENKKGIIHVSLMGGGIAVYFIVGVILPSTMSLFAYLDAMTILNIFGWVAYAAMGASAIWGLVEGVQILTAGDAGLAAKGYAVAPQVPPQGYGPQGYGPQGYGGYGPQGPQGYGPQQNGTAMQNETQNHDHDQNQNQNQNGVNNG